MQDYEKLGVFYLGREYNFAEKKLKENLLLYDSKDLVTHALCVGMTGSGKTGLCISLLEEAAIDGIPSIIVDPKGDLPNLLLTFPELKDADFLPWVDDEQARQKGITKEAYAHEQAESWKKGLEDWGQNPERIRKLKNSAEFTIYTPGSSAGIPVSILKSFAAPEKALIDDSDLLQERINTTVSGLLTLIGIEADPIQSREHILLSAILETEWKQSKDLDLAALIQFIQNPPVQKIGVFDVNSFFPSKERFALAMKLNNLLAAPGFSTWLEGAPLDINQILHTPSGKPRVSIFSIAHLDDAQRMFFVTLLLSQVLGWMRSQAGTPSLRAIFYMDEIFGYFPPVANPPSKQILLTLLKQARAFGLGIVLSTQNPVDLDYKGLSNAGTWFIGRLQTEQDKARILDGLAGSVASAKKSFDRSKLDHLISGLGKRIFVMNNVHEDEPVVFQSRWALSYLCGPLTRTQIKTLTDPQRTAEPIAQAPAQPWQPVPALAAKATKPVTAETSVPVLPPDVTQYYFPAKITQPQNTQLYYHPTLLSISTLYFADESAAANATKKYSYITDLPDIAASVNWDNAKKSALTENDLHDAPAQNAIFGELTKEAASKSNYVKWTKDFKEWLYRTQTLSLFKSPSLKMVSQPDESERDFRIRLQVSTREKRDEIVENIRKKYAAKAAQLQEKIRIAQMAIQREQEQASQQKIQTAISIGSTILDAFFGRKTIKASTIGKATTSVRGAGRVFKESQDVNRAKENLAAAQSQLDELQNQITLETEQISRSIDPQTEQLESITLHPKKTDITISIFSLAWLPYWQDEKSNLTPAW